MSTRRPVDGATVFALGTPARTRSIARAGRIALRTGALVLGIALAAQPLRAQDDTAFGRAVQLSTAIMTNDTLTVRRILATGHDVDSPSGNDNTALMSAAAWGRLDLARLLLARGADPLLENKSGETARDLAARNGHRDLTLLLEAAERGQPLPTLRANTSGKPNFEVAVQLALNAGLGDMAKVEELLATGIDPNFPLGGDRRALHSAGYYGRTEIVKRLLAAGADPALRDSSSRTARDMALASGHADVASLLAAASGIAEPARRRRAAPAPAPAAAPATAPAPTPTPAARKDAPAPAAAPAAPAVGPNTTLAPTEFAPTGVAPRAGRWKGTITNQGAGKWTVAFQVAANGDITEIAFDGDIRCNSGAVGFGREYGRSESAGYVTRGARVANQRGAFHGTYQDEKAGVHWEMQGAFATATTAQGKLRIGAHAGQCDTWGLTWTAKRVG